MSIEYILNQIKFDIDLTNDVLLKTIWKHKKKKVDHHRYCVIMWCANENNMTNINFAQIVSKHKWASIVSSHKYKWAFPFTIDQWFLFPNIIIYAHSCYRCFFDLLIIPLSYNFGGRFRSIYTPISFGVSALTGYEAIPFGIQTLLNLHPYWAMMQVNVKNAFNNVFQAII
jgi:hypothetical protein